MWLIIAKKEFTTALRDRTALAYAVVIWSLVLIAGLIGYSNYRQQENKRREADALFQKEWNEQQANPHSAAHFGTWLFKPSGTLSMYDFGLNRFTGVSYRVEAHRQHEVNYSVARETGASLRFGELSVALIFQLVVPLFIILLCHHAITREKEGNTLRMLMVQGANARSVLWGKTAGNYAVVCAVMLPALLFMGVPAIIQREGWRFIIFSLLYAAYFFLVVAAVINISAWSRSSRASLVVSVGVWVLFSILVPKITVNWIDVSIPLPSRFTLSKTMQEAYTKGMDNDGDVRQRQKAYLQQILSQYGVDTVTKLPVNFDGLAMQYGEDYQSKVYARHAGKTEKQITEQQHRIGMVSLLDPYMAVQQLSMGISGTDYFHHIAFHSQARRYRDAFIRTLNLEMVKGDSAYLSYDYTVGPEFFRKMKTFEYKKPSLGSSLTNHLAGWLSVAGWLLLMIIAANLSCKKIN